MFKCQEGLQIFHLMFATSTTNMTTWYVPTLWLAKKSIFSKIVPALMPQHTENITRIIEHIKHILCTINPQNTRGGYAFARRAIITLFTHTFSLESCHSALNTISPIQYIRYDGSSRPFCFAYNVSNMTWSPFSRHICAMYIDGGRRGWGHVGYIVHCTSYMQLSMLE